MKVYQVKACLFVNAANEADAEDFVRHLLDEMAKREKGVVSEVYTKKVNTAKKIENVS